MNRVIASITFVLLFGSTLFGGARTQQPQSPDTTTQNDESGKPVSPSLRFSLYREYLIVVTCASAGQEHLNFLVDTGADPTVLDRQAAEKLQLQGFAAGQVTNIEGVARGESAILPELQLGPVHVSNLKVLVADLSFLEKSLGIRIDGMVGIDVLGKLAVTIDYKTREMSFAESALLDFSAPYVMTQHFPTVEITLNGEPFKLMVDTGASSLMLFASHVAGKISPKAGGKLKHSTNMSGALERAQVLLQDVILGDADLGEEAGFLVTDQKGANTEFDGLLSPVALGITRMSMDPRRGMMGFTFRRAPRHVAGM